MSDDTEWDALAGLAPVAPERTVRYGQHPSQVIDLYGQGNGRRITVLHGGFWREKYDRGHLTPLAAALAGHGYAVELVEYRRVGGGGGWPQTVEDIDAALEALGPPPHVLLGHSAGGQLALWAAAKRERAASARILAVSPLADLRRAHELRLSDEAVSEFLGGEEELVSRLSDADPMKLMPRVPVEILHGTADRIVPVELSRRYTTDWGARLHLLASGHFAPVTPNTPAFGVLLDSLR
ncbi:alpha/beta fold hydrolase [Streptomyces sp. N2-109]|uniref:Alpha/beta fold hydrolase n=1 Tax=Streptomyces gossypii TaxID=2883101 RepID=A0ABT2JR25_9ACTN|nr:alpha/beta hydrolase [Streptomyces gossypii]MCT2589719.1 alpha/beta fold hydrolase [Streptomyces gossypii]